MRPEGGFGSDHDTQLEPYLVYPGNTDLYTVVDGNFRLAQIQLSWDREFRDKVKINPLPPFRTNIPAITAAVFDTRREILPHKIRNQSYNRNARWKNDEWATVIQQGMNVGHSVDDIAKFANYRNGTAETVEVYKVLKQMNAQHENRCQLALSSSLLSTGRKNSA